MRMGAIFARGSCRALKWMALLGVVFALGAGSAAAQVEPDLHQVLTLHLDDPTYYFTDAQQSRLGHR